MPRMLRRAAVLGGTAHLAAKRGAAKATAAQEAAAPPAPAPVPAPEAPVEAAPAAEAPAPPAPDPAPGASADPYGDLMKIKELFDAGVLTQEEFDAQKKKILGS